jgi:CHAT domain-containing protein
MDQGLKAYRQGAFEDAALHWLEAARIFEQADRPKEESEALTYLSQAYESLGVYTKAVKSLELALARARQSGDEAQVAAVLGSLGNALIAVGRTEHAHQSLTEALALAQTLQNPALTAGIFNTMGNLATDQRKHEDAVGAYQESAALALQAGDRLMAVRALSNAALVLAREGRHKDALARLDQAWEQIQGVPSSHDKAYGLISMGLLFHDLRPHLPDAQDLLLLRASRLFTEAAAVAEAIGDPRAASYAWGHLGRLYEGERRYEEALHLTRKAIFAAQQVNAPEALYRWQWQTGRLLKAQGKMDDAVGAYRRAVRVLQPLRQEMALGHGRTQSAFRDTVGPLFFELADLLLQRAARTTERKEYEPYLVEARDVVESLKAAELQDYFRDDCVEAMRSHVKSLDIVSQTAVVVYPILLPDRTELLVSFPAGLKRFAVPVGAAALTQEVRAFRHNLEKRASRSYLVHAQRLYDWLIRPLEQDLAATAVNTLVFVPDGPLRTVPMAALHDGKEFLIAKYAVATTPGLNLTDPRPLKREAIRLLSGGLTESVQGFPALPNVSSEIQAIRKLYGGDVLLDKDFIVTKLEKELKEGQFSIVHIASHGNFDSDVENTFILTFDGKLTMDRLDQYVGLFKFRDKPLELLTLSACETAAGDDRAALGLAGIAIKAGARSALATLWFINDEAASALIAEFYRQLQDPSVSKAVALQRAQVKMLEHPVYRHPAYWAPFLLLNNWL